jgi:hypothetical protein
MEKPRRKRNAVWHFPVEELKELVARSQSLSDIVRAIGPVNGNSFAVLKHRLETENIDHSHIQKGHGANSGRRFARPATPFEEILTKNSSYNRCWLKKRLLQSGKLIEKCACCDLGNEWHGKKLVLVLDHKNGIHNDNRIENLRLLCPNCNSQMDTFCGKNKKYKM